MQRRFILPLLALLSIPACSGGSATSSAAGADDAGDAAPSADSGSQSEKDAGSQNDDAGPSPTALRGRVLGASGRALGGYTVRIGDVVTKTAADGRFFVNDAPATYDAVVNGPALWATIHAGLTTREPVLVSAIEPSPPASARLLFRHTATANTTRIGALVAGRDVGPSFFDGPGTARGDASWGFGTTTDLDVLSLVYEYSSIKGIQSFTGQERTSITVRDGEVREHAPVIGAIEAREVAVDATLAQGQAIENAFLALRFPGTRYWRGIGAPTTPIPAPTKVVVPRLANMDIAIAVVTVQALTPPSLARATTTTYVPVGSEGPMDRVAIQAPPTFVSPAANDTDFGPGTRIEWSSGGTCSLSIASGSDVTPRWTVVTNDTSFVVPDLRSVNRALLPKTLYSLRVECTSTDAQGRVTHGTSDVRSVTTR